MVVADISAVLFTSEPIFTFVLFNTNDKSGRSQQVNPLFGFDGRDENFTFPIYFSGAQILAALYMLQNEAIPREIRLRFFL